MIDLEDIRQDIFDIKTVPKVLYVYRGDTFEVDLDLTISSSELNSVVLNCDGLPEATPLTLLETTTTSSKWHLVLNKTQTLILAPKTHNFTITIVRTDGTELTLYKGIMTVNNRVHSNYSNNYYIATLLKQTAPTVSDNDYLIGTMWVNVLTDRVYFLTSIVNNEAKWIDYYSDLLDLDSKLDKNFTVLPNQATPLLTDVMVLNSGETVQKTTLGALLALVDTELFVPVSVLPEIGQTNKIYLVPSSEPETQNELDEFIWVNNNWELLGTVSIDLSDYFNKTEINSMLNDKVAKNANITAETKTKITYDVKGLVTGGADLEPADIPTLPQTKITNLGTDLGNKVNKNADIVGATKAKITYDSKGLVTSGDDLEESDIPTLPASKITQDANNRFVTDNDKSTWNGKQNALTAGDGISIVDDVISADSGLTVEDWNTATKTLALSDANKLFRCFHTDNQTVIIPTHSSVPFPAGTMITFLSYDNRVTFSGESGVTLTSIDGLVELATQFGMASLIKTDTNTWQLVGAL